MANSSDTDPAPRPAGQNQIDPRGFMTDEGGKPSNMRLLASLSMAVAILLTGLVGLMIYQGQQSENLPFLFNLILVWIVGAFAPKTAQKFVEARFFNQPNNVDMDTEKD